MARSPRTVHVVPHADGWAIRAASGRTSKTFSSQAAAVKAAQAVVRDGGGQLIVQTPNGRMRKSFTLGRAAMEKLNAVEGFVLTPAMKKVFKDFDREGVTPVQRRAELRRKIGKLASSQKVVGKGARHPPTSSKG